MTMRAATQPTGGKNTMPDPIIESYDERGRVIASTEPRPIESLQSVEELTEQRIREGHIRFADEADTGSVQRFIEHLERSAGSEGVHIDAEDCAAFANDLRAALEPISRLCRLLERLATVFDQEPLGSHGRSLAAEIRREIEAVRSDKLLSATQPAAMPGIRRVVHELRLSASVFRDYAQQHQDKADIECDPREKAERQRKAKRNFDRAAACEAALDDFDAAATAMPEEEVMRRAELNGMCATVEADAVSALRYIERHHGRLSGVGWDRVFDAHEALFAKAREYGLDNSTPIPLKPKVDEDAEWLRSHARDVDRHCTAIRLERIAARLEDGRDQD